MTPRPAASAEDEAFWRDIERAYGDSAIHGALGLSIAVVAPGEVRVAYDGTEAAGNRSRHVAGGALAAMIDSAATQAIRTLVDRRDRVVTVDLSVSFVRPAAVGERLSTVGRAEHVGGSLGVARATTTRESGEIVAIGTATLAIRRASAIEKDRK